VIFNVTLGGRSLSSCRSEVVPAADEDYVVFLKRFFPRSTTLQISELSGRRLRRCILLGFREYGVVCSFFGGLRWC